METHRNSCFTGESLRTETRVAVDVILASCAVLTDVGAAVVNVVVTVATAVALTTLAPVNDDVKSRLTRTYPNVVHVLTGIRKFCQNTMCNR